MEIAGIGTQITECVKIRQLIDRHGELFLKRVFTNREIAKCQKSRLVTERFAEIWAAKEAVWKCLARFSSRVINWREIEILEVYGSNTEVILHGGILDAAQRMGVSVIKISSSSCRQYAVAYATALQRHSPKANNLEEEYGSDIPF